MTRISKFKAIRPVRDKVHLVATRPYYTYKKNVLKAKLEDNPYTFLHIINPEFRSHIKTKPNSPERFQLVREQFDDFVNEGIFIQDDSPKIYVYRQTVNGHEFTGIVAGASVQEYQDDKIKKHEATLTSREEMFVNYLDHVGFNAEPVLLSHEPSEEINNLLGLIVKDRPEYEFSTTDMIKHELWIVENSIAEKLDHAFENLNAVYIADGHHRSASSCGLLEKRKKEGRSKYQNEEAFLAFFIDENRLKILEFNRLIKKLSCSKDELLKGIEKSFDIKEIQGARKPKYEHEFTMCFEGKWFELQYKQALITEEHPVNNLDAEILTQKILSPVLGITDLKTDSNIEFSPGVEPIEKIEEAIQKGKYQLAFFLFPATMKQVKEVADHKMIMPPKSTWVEPKLRSGLTIYSINE